MQVLNRIAAFVTQFVTPIYVLRAPLIAAITAYLFLSTPDQTLEIYRALALDRAKFAPQIGLSFATLTLASIVIWYLGRLLTLRWQQEQLSVNSVTGILLRWLPRVIGALPLFGAAVGLVAAARKFSTTSIPDWIDAQMPGTLEVIKSAAAEFDAARALLFWAAGIAAGLGLLLILLTFLRSFRKQWKYETPSPMLFGPYTRVLFYVIVFGLVITFSGLFAGEPREYGRLATSLGAFTIFNLFILCFAFFLCVLTNIYDRTHFPALSLIVVGALLSTAFDLNDNHEIRSIKKDAFLPLPSSFTGFQQWLDSRPDKEYYKARGEDYPVYVVAAQGGGLYAAQHVALMMARLQDRCPGFAQHVFAISGVSGGSLGGAVFSSLVNERPTPTAEPTCKFGASEPGFFEQRTMAMLDRDFVSPLTAAGFFPDFLQRLLPYPIPAFDRARALEASFEQAWAEAIPESKGNPFAESFYKQWKPTGMAPALVLNTTQVATGGRVVAAPFRFYQQQTSLPTLNSMIKADIRLSTAVGISARFPWILPPASWRRGTVEQYRFVDGGYFEASGIDTGQDLVKLLDEYTERLRDVGKLDVNVSVKIIALTVDDVLQEPTQTPNIARLRELRTQRSGFDEIASPLETLMNTRWERGVVSMARAAQDLCPACFTDREDHRTYAGLDGDARMYRLNFTDFALTVGWQVSSVTGKLVSAHSGFAERCRAARPELRETWPWMAQVLNENNCSSCQIMYALTARQKELDNIAPSLTGASIYNKSEIPTWIELCRSEAGTADKPTYRTPARGLPPEIPRVLRRIQQKIEERLQQQSGAGTQTTP
jgi:hypothetical protein